MNNEGADNLPRISREPRVSRGPDEVPLALTADEFRAAGHAMVDRVAELLAGLPDRPGIPGLGPRSADRPVPGLALARGTAANLYPHFSAAPIAADG